MFQTIKPGEQNTLVNSIVLFMGAFTIAYNLAIGLHETGHVLAYLLAGEEMVEFVLNPFSWSWATGRQFNVFVLWGGVTFGQLFALVPYLWARKSGSPLFLFLAKTLAASSLLINGIYLCLGALLNFGDGGSLVHMGLSPFIPVVSGSVYMLASLFFWTDLQPHLGLGASTPLKIRCMVITGGIGPYMALIFIYNLRHNPGQLAIWGGLAGAGIAAAVGIAIAGRLFSGKTGSGSSAEVAAGRNACPVLVSGLLIIIAEFIIFGMPANPF